MSQQLPPKRDVMLALLEQADSVFVQFDPRRQGVVLPAHLKRQPRVVLQYGMNMPIPIRDLEVDDQGIGATLSFSHTPSWTFVPWSAVFAIVTNDQQHGMLWEADVPHDPEAEARLKPDSAAASGKSKPARGGKGRPALRAVRSDEGAPAIPSPDAEAPEPTAPEAAEAAAQESKPPSVDGPAPAAESKAADADAAAEAKPSERPAGDAVEPPPRDPPRKKRELPPYLRVVK